MIRVLVWNEFAHEKSDEAVKAIYPEGIHKTIADFLSANEDLQVRTATLDDEDCGLTEEVLANTDVLIWWAHVKHKDVPDEIVERVQNAVLSGMGFIALHSAHHSKIFRRLMGTGADLGWRENGDRERLWILNHNHPILAGISDRYIELEHEETYSEPFSIPNPDEVLMIGSYEGSEVFRSAVTFHRDQGRIFYFQPGHETVPTFHHKQIQQVITNAVRYVAPVAPRKTLGCPHIPQIDK